VSTYDPEKGGARDLPRERYLRVAYLTMRKSFGPELLGMIAARGEDEFVRVAGEVMAHNGFVFTRPELALVFSHLEKKAGIDLRRERIREAWIDHGNQRGDKPERPN
jgi:hypothetical protein